MLCFYLRGDFLKKYLSFALAILLSVSIFTSMPKANAFTKPVGAGRVNTTSSSLNVRSAPSANATVKTTLPKNSYLTLISKNGSYWYVRYSENGYGYCHANYIYQVSGTVKTVNTSSGSLRVRSGASTSHAVTGYLQKGQFVSIHATSGDFARIIYNGNKTGYVHSSYLKSVSASTTNKYNAKSLNVPSFKQTDPRWANVTLGNSGQTIGRIGCATTALAMTHSYATNTTVYPHQMAKKLSYTSGGAVYWPTDYNIITSSSGYLEKIYSLIHQGKPVIVGAKKASGGQHYVVVKGVTATDVLSTHNFIINDPGSETRTTLADFFGAYPYFYKMLYIK